MKETNPSTSWPPWIGPTLFLLTAAVVVLLGLLAFSIMERRWETQRPSLAVIPIAEWEPDNAVWGQNYPRQYESYLRTRDDTTRTRHGGGYPRDYLEIYPHINVLYAGSAFDREYLQGRGHYHAHADVTSTKRLTAASPATCWTCKTTEAPRLMAELGVAEFYATPFKAFVDRIRHPIGCQDCHDPATMNLRITRPALREGFAAMGRDIDEATHQEMRTRVESIQDTVERARIDAQDALARAHIDLAAAMQVGIPDAELDPLRRLLRHAQFRWDVVASNNGMGFHAPQECTRLLGDSRAQAQEARIGVARLLAARGISAEPRYPDFTSREQVQAFVQALLSEDPPALLPDRG